MEYCEDEFLQLSGIQHFCFCRRQWALIHIENQWQENVRTIEGNIVHERCHDDGFIEKRGNLLITRSLSIFSRRLGVSGQCDVVEFSKTENGCTLYGREGLWLPYPIEYKRGKSKLIDADRLQLCCQAMCREEIAFTASMRENVESMLREMHNYYRQGYTPNVKPKKGCSLCSLKDICLPVICRKTVVADYYAKFLNEDAL